VIDNLENVKTKKFNTTIFVIVTLVIFIIGGVFGSTFSIYWFVKRPSFLPPPPVSVSSTVSNPIEISYPTDKITSEDLIPIVAEKISNTVTRIDVSTKSLNGAERSLGFGSGFIVSTDGYILTNNHVIQKAQIIKVTLKSGKSYIGKLVGTDPISDIALVKINATNLPYSTLGDSDKVRIGETVIAIGNPYGYDYSVTTGVISGIQREITLQQQQEQTPLPDPYNYFSPFDSQNQTQTQPTSIPMVGIIQTDAAINPGNSGGPLINLKGEVIGINFLIESSGQGLGFAVSSNNAKKVMNELLKSGSVSWPSLGIGINEIDDSLIQEMNLKVNQGIYIGYVADGPSKDAGIKVNDIITKIDNKSIVKSSDLISYIRNKKVGDTVVLTINRNGKEMNIKVKLTELKR
jgi:serine protease Do